MLPFAPSSEHFLKDPRDTVLPIGLVGVVSPLSTNLFKLVLSDQRHLCRWVAFVDSTLRDEKLSQEILTDRHPVCTGNVFLVPMAVQHDRNAAITSPLLPNGMLIFRKRGLV